MAEKKNVVETVTKVEYDSVVAELAKTKELLAATQAECEKYIQAVNKLINVAAQRYAQDLANEVLGIK